LPKFLLTQSCDLHPPALLLAGHSITFADDWEEA